MQTRSRTSSDRRLIVLYLAVVVLFWASLYAYMPTLSVYVESKATNLAMVGVVLAMYGLWQAVIRFPLGVVADWVGRRKPFIIGGLAFSALGAVLMALSDGVVGLAIGRAFTGFAASAWVLLVVAFSGLFPPEDAVRASAMLSAVNAISRMIITGLTGSLNALGGYSLSFYVAAVAAGLAIPVMLFVKEPPRTNNQKSLRQVGALIVRRDVLIPALLGAVMQYTIWSSTFGFTTNLAKNLGASDVTLSLLVSMNIGLVLLGNLATTAVVNRVGSRRMVALSFIFTGLGMGAFVLAQGVSLIFVGQVLMGLASGVGYPVLMGLSIRYVDDAQRATAMGLYQAVYAIGMFAGPWLSGILADGMGIQPMFAITGAVCAALGLLGTALLRARD
ncbi:MAG: MFS transporter [Anaerolineae bacterium]|nr:MFS transporter [Anaerolineae bacterium]